VSTAGKRGFGEFERALGPSFAEYIKRRAGGFVDMDGGEMGFVIDRERLDEATFSAEAVDGLVEHFRSWLYSRIWREWKETGEPPKHLFAHVKVAFEDVSDNLQRHNEVETTGLLGERE
jgi:hypothetical protein